MPDAAWYPDPADPSNPSRARWWDGAAWTEHTRDVGEVRAPLAEAVAQPTPYVPMQRSVDADAHALAGSAAVASPVIRAGGPFTAAIVLFALLPGIAAFAPKFVPGGDQLVVRLAASIVVIAASVALAVWDRHALDTHGYTRSNLPQPAFAIIPVLYLLVRVFRVGATSILFIVVWGGLQAGAYAFEASDALGLAGGSLPIGAAPTNTTGYDLDAPYTAADRAFLLTVAGMEAKVAHDVKTTSPVTCEPFPSTDLGATTTCDVQLPAGAGVRETLEVQGDDAVEPWIVESTAPE